MQKLLNNINFTLVEHLLNLLIIMLVRTKRFLISLLMLSSSFRLSLIICPRYLNWETYTSLQPSKVKSGKFIRPHFYVLLVFVDMSSVLWLLLVKLSVLAKWLARKTLLRKPNHGEGIMSTKPRLKSVYDFIGLLYCLITLRAKLSGAMYRYRSCLWACLQWVGGWCLLPR